MVCCWSRSFWCTCAAQTSSLISPFNPVAFSDRCYISLSSNGLRQQSRRVEPILSCIHQYQFKMKLHFDLHQLTLLFTLVSSTNLFRSDASINTVEEFLDTLINSSRYDRRIRPFFDQRSAFFISFPCRFSFSSSSRTMQCHNDYSY